jgi:hypothetical protein
MKPGDIYDVVFPYKPPLPPDGTSYKGLPTLIISISPNGTALALMVKITDYGPTPKFPNRIRIVSWQHAKLDKPSYAEIDSEEYFDLEDAKTYRGTLSHKDLNNVLKAYIQLKSSTNSLKH